MIVEIAVIVLYLGMVALLAWLRRVFTELAKIRYDLHIIQQRFFEGGVDLVDRQLATDVKVPESWQDIDHLPDEDIPARTPILSRRDEWVDAS